MSRASLASFENALPEQAVVRSEAFRTGIFKLLNAVDAPTAVLQYLRHVTAPSHEAPVVEPVILF